MFPKTGYPLGYPKPALQQKTEERERDHGTIGRSTDPAFKTLQCLRQLRVIVCDLDEYCSVRLHSRYVRIGA